MSAPPGPATGTVGATVPSWALRAGFGIALGGSTAVIAAWTTPPGLPFFLLCAFAVLSLVQPGSHLTTAYTVTAATCVLIDTDAGVTAWTFLAVLGLHAVHWLGALAGLVPLDSDVEWAALTPSVRRFLLVQAGTQLLVLLAYLVTR